MAINHLANVTILQEKLQHILLDVYGDILSFVSDSETISLDKVKYILNYPIIKPIYRITVLHDDETVDYVIPNSDIIEDGISYDEQYTNGSRRTLSLKLNNVSEYNDTMRTWGKLLPEEKQVWNNDSELYYKYNTNQFMKYMPNTQGLWYGKKIKYDIGFNWMGSMYYFDRGVYIIDSFDVSHGIKQKEVIYQLKDKFRIFEGNTGTLESGYEIPVGTPVEEAIVSLLNFSNPNGNINDIKPCVIDSKFAGFKTQATIRVDMGGKQSDIYEQLATQMSAEYYYNTMGHLSFYPKDESMNEINKPIVWRYELNHIDNFNLKPDEDIVNVVKVVGDNVNGQIFTAIAKNENLNSPINIFYINERMNGIIQNANVWSDDMAQELADYELRKKTIILINQTINVPFNPMLMVNNLIEINIPLLNIKNQRFVINAISHTSGNPTMSISIANVDELPIVGSVIH